MTEDIGKSGGVFLLPIISSLRMSVPHPSDTHSFFQHPPFSVSDMSTLQHCNSYTRKT